MAARPSIHSLKMEWSYTGITNQRCGALQIVFRVGDWSTPLDLPSLRLASSPDSILNSMFLTQPPAKRVIVTVEGGRMTEERVELQKDEGVRIGDVLSFIRKTKAVDVMSKKTGGIDFTTIEIDFIECPTSGSFMQMQQLESDGFGGVSVRCISNVQVEQCFMNAHYASQ